MTRKDYVAFAKMMYRLKPVPFREATENLWNDTVNSMADVFAKDNPSFDYTRFLAACRHGK